jgi:hypothetical protein
MNLLFESKCLKTIHLLLFLLGSYWQPVELHAQTPAHLQALCTTMKSYLETSVSTDLTKAIATKGLGDLSVIETNLPTITAPTLVIKKDAAVRERTYIWDPLEERLEYCKVMCVFFGLGTKDADWTRNAVALKTALDNSLTSNNTVIASKTLNIVFKSGKLFSVNLENAPNTTHDKRCRLPKTKALDPLTNKYPYIMNFEIKPRIVSASDFNWQQWEDALDVNLNIHKKYINIHLSLPFKDRPL